MRAETALITRFSAVDDIFHDADRFAERVPFAESLQDFYYDHFCHGGGQTVPDLSEYRLKPIHTANDKKTGPRHDSGISIYQIPDSLLTAAEAKVYEETGAGYEATLAAIIDGVWLDSNLGLVFVCE